MFPMWNTMESHPVWKIIIVKVQSVISFSGVSEDHNSRSSVSDLRAFLRNNSVSSTSDGS